MIQILDTRINRYVALTTHEANSLNLCRELMLQAWTYYQDGQNVDSLFTLAREQRESHAEFSPAWSLCENSIAGAQAKIYIYSTLRNI